MEKGPEWKLNRLRFTVAHELAHYFLHRDLPQAAHFASLSDFAHCARINDTGGSAKKKLRKVVAPERMTPRCKRYLES
jgi:predicted SprT family Zn-dependent metalloprotease